MARGCAIFTVITLSAACLIEGISASNHYDYDYPGIEQRQPRASENDNSTSCGSYEFQCENGGCVNANYKCDGDRDCNDGSDEVDCPCDESNFRCTTSGICLSGWKKCNDRRDCEDGSDELGCDENVLRRLTEGVGEGENFFLEAVSEAGIESKTKYELFDSIQIAFEAVQTFRNSSLFEAADAAYSKLRSVLKTEEWRKVSDEEKVRFNEETGNVLELANQFAEEANKFIMHNSENKVDKTDKDNYSPEARMFFLQLKWYMLWSGAVYDLGLRTWTRFGPGHEPNFFEIEDQAKGDMLQAIEVIKEAMDGVLDTAMDRIGYTVYKAYEAVQCLMGPRSYRRGCTDEGLMALIPLVQAFSSNVNEAINS